MTKINSLSNPQCGFVCKVPLKDDIEFYEKRLIPMIKEYGEKEMNLKLEDVERELKRMKEEYDRKRTN